jgi:hypothetical protein
MTSCTGLRRHASATLDKGPAVGPATRAASRCHRRTTTATPAVMAAVTTRISTAISACKTHVFSLGYAEFKYPKC